jgi:DNA-binding response OmpR family regulator
MIARVPQLASHRGFAAPRCLIVEQDVQLLAVLIELFANAGYDVDNALHDDNWRRVAARIRPHLAVIGDGACGTYDAGWRVARALKHVDAALPLIMLTSDDHALAEVGTTLRGRMFAAGLRKPFPVAELLSVAKRLCPPGNTLDRSA